MSSINPEYISDSPTVTRPQIEALERGEIVPLTSSQLDDLHAHAPSWVAVYVHPEQESDGRNLTVIKNMSATADEIPKDTMAEIRRQIAKDLKAQQQKGKH